MRQVALGFLVAGSLLLSHVDTAAAESAASSIEQTYNAWVRATNAKDIEQWSAYLAPQAVFQPPGAPLLETKEAISDYYRRTFSDPNFALDCQQSIVVVARSGEMAWARGVCRATFTDAEGLVANGKSRWFKVWLKQADGSWKCKLNTWNNVAE